jgi:hypothetical protein
MMTRVGFDNASTARRATPLRWHQARKAKIDAVVCLSVTEAKEARLDSADE